MSRFHSKAYLWAALAITLMAGPAQAQSGSFEERRQLMRQMTQQLQARLEQRLRCINQAKSSGDLDSCQRTNSTGWHGWSWHGWLELSNVVNQRPAQTQSR